MSSAGSASAVCDPFAWVPADAAGAAVWVAQFDLARLREHLPALTFPELLALSNTLYEASCRVR